VEARRSRVPRSGIALATPEAPLTWEGWPRRLRGAIAGTHAHSISVVEGGEKGVGSLGVVERGWVACSRLVSRCGQARYGVVGHPFAARGGMECCDRCGRSGSIRGGDSPRGGGS
jgi:hypothetical protein